MAAPEHDALLLLKQSIASNSPVVPTTSADASVAPDANLSLAKATHLQFSNPVPISLPLATPTRLISSDNPDKPFDLRSVYFAYLKKDSTVPEYNASAQALDAELKVEGGAGGSVQHLGFVEKVELMAWLEGASEESDYIKPLPSDSASAVASTQVASGQAGGTSAAAISDRKMAKGNVDPRLLEIYAAERRMGDRNSVLRGLKPTDFTRVRNLAKVFNPNKEKPTAANGAHNNMNPNNARPSRRPDPIILLSPSASSLLRMSNIKSFLENGIYVPAESSISTSSNSATLLNMSRLLPDIDNTRPMRFVIVETPEQFKPEYWNRVVAVFTTGQQWQFKSYKWQDPTELFRHTLGIYVGWRGDQAPGSVRGWGRGVFVTSIEKYSPQGGASGRWRDREVVEGIWKAIQSNMISKGWRRDAAPTLI